MTQVSKTLIGDDLWSMVYANGSGIPVVAGSRRALESNQHIIVFDDTGKPANYNPLNNRHTIAMDVYFLGGQLEHCHMGLVSRHKGSGQSPHVLGDNRSAAIIAGNWSFGGGSLALEEIEIKDNYANGDSHTPYAGSTLAPGRIQEGRWYRFAIDSISLNGQIGHELRVWDKTTNPAQGIYALAGTFWSQYPHNYTARDAGKVALFNIPSPAVPNAGFYVKNLVSYWSDGGEWVANP